MLLKQMLTGPVPNTWTFAVGELVLFATAAGRKR
jgi:hypothetical protein